MPSRNRSKARACDQEAQETVTQWTTFDGRPLLYLTRRVRLEEGHRRFACSVCGLVYVMRSTARVCCGEKKYKAGVAYWWPSRKLYKPYFKPVGRLDGDGELTLYDKE